MMFFITLCTDANNAKKNTRSKKLAATSTSTNTDTLTNTDTSNCEDNQVDIKGTCHEDSSITILYDVKSSSDLKKTSLTSSNGAQTVLSLSLSDLISGDRLFIYSNVFAESLSAVKTKATMSLLDGTSTSFSEAIEEFPLASRYTLLKTYGLLDVEESAPLELSVSLKFEDVETTAQYQLASSKSSLSALVYRKYLLSELSTLASQESFTNGYFLATPALSSSITLSKTSLESSTTWSEVIKVDTKIEKDDLIIVKGALSVKKPTSNPATCDNTEVTLGLAANGTLSALTGSEVIQKLPTQIYSKYVETLLIHKVTDADISSLSLIAKNSLSTCTLSLQSSESMILIEVYRPLTLWKDSLSSFYYLKDMNEISEVSEVLQTSNSSTTVQAVLDTTLSAETNDIVFLDAQSNISRDSAITTDTLIRNQLSIGVLNNAGETTNPIRSNIGSTNLFEKRSYGMVFSWEKCVMTDPGEHKAIISLSGYNQEEQPMTANHTKIILRHFKSISSSLK